jgi:hypothetical protein
MIKNVTYLYRGKATLNGISLTFPQGKGPLRPLDRRLTGPKSQFELCGEKNKFPPAGIRTLTVKLVKSRYAV